MAIVLKRFYFFLLFTLVELYCFISSLVDLESCWPNFLAQRAVASLVSLCIAIWATPSFTMGRDVKSNMTSMPAVEHIFIAPVMCCDQGYSSLWLMWSPEPGYRSIYYYSSYYVDIEAFCLLGFDMSLMFFFNYLIPDQCAQKLGLILTICLLIRVRSGLHPDGYFPSW